MCEKSINDIIADLKNITLSCIQDAESDNFDELELHIKKRADIIDMLKLSEKPSDYIANLLKANDVYILDEKLTKTVVQKKQDIHEKMTSLTTNNNASKKYKSSQLMTNVFFNIKR